MAQSLSKLFVHIVFHIKSGGVEIDKEDRADLYAYIGAIIKDNDSIPILINGVGDHLHILCVQSKNIAMAKLVEEIKRHSSRWIKTKNEERYAGFAWQGGYGAFSVSPTLHDKTKNYIKNQEIHHHDKDFKEEYRWLLDAYGVDYDEKYLWTD